MDLNLKSYMSLVDNFPLIPIEDDEHLSECTTTLDELQAREPLDSGEEAYFVVLSQLVTGYLNGTNQGHRVVRYEDCHA